MFTLFCRKQIDDDITAIHEYPSGVALALNVTDFGALLSKSVVQFVAQAGKLSQRMRRSNNEEVREARP